MQRRANPIFSHYEYLDAILRVILISIVMPVMIFAFTVGLSAINLTQHPENTSDFVAFLTNVWVYVGLYSAFSILAAILIRNEVSEIYYLADMPWKQRVWPWLLTLVMGPAFWVAVVVSLVKMAIYKPQVPPNRHDAGRQYYGFTMAMFDRIDEMTGRPSAPAATDVVSADDLPDYVSSPGVGKSSYLKARTEAGTDWRRERLQAIDEEIANATKAMRALSTLIQAHRDKRRSLEVEREQIRELTDTAEDAAMLAKIAEEFDRIMILPGVIAVQVIGGRVRFIVRGSYDYDGETYDLGDWYIEIGPDTTHLKARPLRSSVRRDWCDGYYPAYRLGDGSFCFDERTQQMDAHLAKGQLLEAVALAVEGINHVNPDDRHKVPAAFQRLATDTEPVQTKE